MSNVSDSGRSPAGKKQSPEKTTVNFRADPAFIQLLEEGAAAAGVESVHLYARKLLERALANSEHAELRHELGQLRAEVRQLRAGVANLANALLVRIGKENPEQVKTWIRENILMK